MEGNLRFKIDGASLIVGRKFTVFALFYFVFEGNFQVQAPGGVIFGGAIKRRVLCVTSLGGLYMEGLIFGILRYAFPKTFKKPPPSPSPFPVIYPDYQKLSFFPLNVRAQALGR